MKRFIISGALLAGILLTGAWLCWHGPAGRAVAPESPLASVTAHRPPLSSPAPAARPPQPMATPVQGPSGAKPVAKPMPTAIGQFSIWAANFATNRSAAPLAMGENLARQRRAEVLQLIQTDPAQALKLAVPYEWRQSLPASVTQYFETQVDGRGDYKVAAGTDFAAGTTTTFRQVQMGATTYQAYVYGRRLAEVCQSSIPLHGIAVAGKMAVASEPLRPLTTGEAVALSPAVARAQEVICSVSGQSAASRGQPFYAEGGGQVLCFCGEDHYRLVNQQWALAESGNNGDTLGTYSPVSIPTAAQDAWTHGHKTVLYIRVNFPDDLTEPISEGDAYAAMDGVNTYYTDNSYNLSGLITTVTPLITMPQVKAYYSPDPGLLLADARAAATAAGYDDDLYDRDVVALTGVPGYTWGGLAYVGGKGVWLQSMGVGVTAHELGHNYGLWHANFWNAVTNFSGFGPGTNLEYGNIWDTMGSGGVAYFNAIHKNALDWMKADAVQSITSNGLYRLYPFDIPGSARVDGRRYAGALRKDALRNYWLEFRSQYPGNAWLANGLLVYFSPWLYSNGGAQLVDTTPGTPNAGDSFSREDAAVVLGRTFNDQAAGVHITPVDRGRSGTNVYIDYQIYLGAPATNQPPTLVVQVDQTNVPVNTVVNFLATAVDPNGDPLAYSWTFDDLTFSTNNQPWIAKSFAKAGDHLVRCVASDLKGGEASANIVVTVGAAKGYQITGYVTDPDGNPLEGVLVGNGSVNAAKYVGGYTDSRGYYTLVNVTSNLNLNAYEKGYICSNAVTWQNPLDVTNPLADIDFTAYPLPWLSIAADTNTVAVTDGSLHQFNIACANSGSNDLTVQINLSGTAVDGTDYTLSPDLNGLSTITIPAGGTNFTFAFHARGNPQLPAPETVTLTLLDDTNMDNPAYALVPLAEATITLVNPNPPAIDTVSVYTPTPDISENGIDDGQLVFTREGALQSSLLVYYTVSGTAVPGLNYDPLPGVAMIPAGQSSVTIPVVPLDGYLVDADQTVTVKLAANPAYTLGSSTSAQLIILNADYTTVTVTATSDAAQPATPGYFTVQREGDLTPALLVHYNSGGTAVPGVDYTALSGSITIPPGAASAEVTISPVASAVLSSNRTVTLNLTNSPNCDVGNPGSATLNLLDGALPVVSVQTTVDNISEQGTQFGEFTISRTGTSGNLPVYFEVSGTAFNGISYAPLTSPAVIPDGASSITLYVIPFQDYILGGPQTVQLNLVSNATYNVGASATATMNILDDSQSSEPAVSFCFASSAFPANQSPGIAVELTVTNKDPVTVDYIVIGGSAPASRYSPARGAVTIPPGAWVGFVPLQINNGTASAPPQTVRVALFNPTNATLGGIKIHTYTILDDNTAAVSVKATVPTALEPGPVNGNFRISRVGPTNASEIVNFQITGSASAPNDYVSLGNFAVIPAGASDLDLPVIPVNSRLLRATQTVVLTLISATNGTIVSPVSATVTLIDNYTNNIPAVTVTATNHPVAYTGGGNGQFLFTRTGPLTNALTVSFVIAGTAVSGVNYVSFTNGVTIPAGQSNAVVNVVPLDDHQVDGDRIVTVALLENGTYHANYPADASVTVQDNDQMVAIDANIFAAAKPATAGQFTFTRVGSTNAAVTLWYTISGTATNGGDYVLITNSIVIPAGNASVTLPILPIETHIVEGPRTVVLALLASTNYVLGTPISATVTIMDDEPMLTIASLWPSVVEGGVSNGVFRITRTGNPEYNFTAYLVAGGTAAYGVDYSAFATNVYFNCGVTSIDLTFTATNGLAAAGTQSVTADLVPNPAYTILYPSNALISILEPGPGAAPVVTITNPVTPTAYLVDTSDGLILQGSIIDPSLTNALAWSEASGPTNLVFDNTTNLNTGVVFGEPGIYVLQLAATNGTLAGVASVKVIVAAEQLAVTNALHWPLTDGTSKNVSDSSGLGRNGVVVGSPSWLTNGIIAGGLLFHGTNDWVVQAGGSNLLNGLNAFTVSLWVQPGSTNADRGLLAADAADVNPTFSLSTRRHASCGDYTNVLEAVIPTSQGVIYRDSASNVLQPGQWNQITVTWTNGAAPALYINGQMDQPAAGFVTLSGVLTNCPQFIVGRGDTNSPAAWLGAIDDVRVWPYALDPAEIAALAIYPATNHGPLVSAGANVQVQQGTPITLAGTVTDDGLPKPPGQVTTTWVDFGTNNLVLTNAASLTNTLTINTPGDYAFRLTANDGWITTFSDITVSALPPTSVSIIADLPSASDMGPVLGDYTITRTGGTDALTVYLAFSGNTSNGLNYVVITNAITIPAGTNSVSFPLIPILDYNIKGDQTATIAILTNIAYTVVGGPATVNIQDSPYGYWSIANFSLEELTYPSISGAAADYSHDGLVNFVCYAFNLYPKMTNANPAFQYAFVVNTNNGQTYLNLTYTRWLPPRVVAYGVYVSNDLQTWNTGTNYVQELASVPAANGLTETVTAQVVAPVSQTTNLFTTIKVWIAQVPTDAPLP